MAKQKYPMLQHILDHPELRAEFSKDDPAANDAKRRAHNSGIWAILLAFISLGVATTAPIWNDLPRYWPVVLTLLASAVGIISLLLIRMGLLHGPKKIEWLRKRLRTERLRQFFFQELVCRIPEIEESIKNGAKGKQQYKVQRASWFKSFLSEYSENRWLDAKMSAITDPHICADPWLHPATGLSKLPDPDICEAIFGAYHELRLKGQLNYANRKLQRDSGNLNFFRMSLLEKRRFLKFIWWFSFASLVVLEAFSVVAALMNREFTQADWPHMFIICLALAAIAARAMEHGMALPAEIERYSSYRAEVTCILNRFDNATALRDKIRLMQEMEEVTFEEMRRFLRQNSEASFVM